MGQINTREVCLFNSTATTSGTGPDINLIQGWQAATVSVNVTTTSGTSPTLDLFIQKKLGQAAATDTAGGFLTGTAIYDDLLHFTQITTTPIRIANLCTGPDTPTANATTITTADWAQSDAALGAATIRVGPIGGLWRVKFTIGGTSPSFAFSVQAQLIPFST